MIIPVNIPAAWISVAIVTLGTMIKIKAKITNIIAIAKILAFSGAHLKLFIYLFI